jgi:hypothetical protein
MSHYAKVVNGIVTKVIVAEQDFINSLSDKDSWIQTSFNTFGGINKRTGNPIRKNYAGKGHIYDSSIDAFYIPKPYNSWKLNRDSCLWESPKPKPDTSKGYYSWNEKELKWNLISTY